MPCGEFTKDKIREIAKEIGLDVHNKRTVKKYALFQIIIMEDTYVKLLQTKLDQETLSISMEMS